jgi:hypothetical protein
LHRAIRSKAKLQKKLKHPVAPEPLPACLELKGDAVEVQEFLQSVVREFQWRVGESHASEDTWSFMRYLNDEDLESTQKPRYSSSPWNSPVEK